MSDDYPAATEGPCEPGEHHWVSSHEPHAPIWIIRCTFCDRHNFEEMLAAHDAEIRAEQIEADAAFVDTFDGGSGIALALRALRRFIRPPAPELIPGVQAAVDALSIYRKG